MAEMEKERRFRIKTKNPTFIGELTAGSGKAGKLLFEAGAAETADPKKVEEFRAHGYGVEEIVEKP